MGNEKLAKKIKSCLRKRMHYTEIRNSLLNSGEYEYAVVIKTLQREYVNHKTKASRVSLIAGLIMLTIFPLVHWYVEHNESDYEISYKPIVFGVVIIFSSFISLQRAKAAARRFEEVV
jgi:hypothetical protein